MNLIELNRALTQLRLGGIAAVLETRLRQAQAEAMTPIDFLSCLVSDELTRRGERLLERRTKQAQFRDPQKTLDNFDFNFNKKMNRSLIFDLATGAFIARHEDGLFLGPPGSGKSHLAQAIGQAAIQRSWARALSPCCAMARSSRRSQSAESSQNLRMDCGGIWAAIGAYYLKANGEPWLAGLPPDFKNYFCSIRYKCVRVRR